MPLRKEVTFSHKREASTSYTVRDIHADCKKNKRIKFNILMFYKKNDPSVDREAGQLKADAQPQALLELFLGVVDR